MQQENWARLNLVLSRKYLSSAIISLLALLFYIASAAPGLTWANQGADGGDLLTAAVINGVPHPPGYPLYTILLQIWLSILGIVLPTSDLAWRGNLLSALCAALSVGVTVLTLSNLLRSLGKSVWPAAIAGAGWAISPLLWSQATITEVYGLHALLFSLLAHWAISLQGKRWYLILFAMVGVAHHLTLLLLLPAALYLRWSKVSEQRIREALYLMSMVVVGIALGLLWHLRTRWVAPLAAPVNWGFATNWSDFWWLISGQAYRSYLLGASAAVTFDRVAAWAYTLTTQFTPFGLAIALIGLSTLDQEKPTLRNFSLLWLLPISLYAILYYTRDSEIYLMPVGWLLTVWLAVGLTVCSEYLAEWTKNLRVNSNAIVASVLIIGVVLLAGWRWPTLSLHNDSTATKFLKETAAVVTPNSIVISRGDEHTFALWYGAWADKELPSDLILVNDALYQFKWYRRLLAQNYPDVAAIDQSPDLLIAQNRGVRDIFLADDSGLVPADSLTAVGPLWKVK